MSIRSDYVTALTLSGLLLVALTVPRQGAAPAGRSSAFASAGIDPTPIGTVRSLEKAKAIRRRP